MKKVIIIGAGIGGLATAIHLAREGWQVEVFEASPGAGGKVAEVRHSGFRFDAGPSLFTLPGLAMELLDPEFQFNTRRLPVITRYFWGDGSKLDAHAGLADFAMDVQKVTGVPSDSVANYLEDCSRVYKLAAPVFIFNTLHRLKPLLKKENIPALLNLHRLKAFSTLHNHNLKRLKDERLVQLFDRYATYNGSNPYQTPATLRVIAHLEHSTGAFLPEKGIYHLVTALTSQAEKLGVKFHFNQPVLRVNIEKGSIAGVITKQGDQHADAVVSNSDIYRFYSQLMPSGKKLKKLEKQQLSSSALIFYWGISGNFSRLEVHNILFGDQYREEFTALFQKYEPAGDPTVYLYISSKCNPADAPPGFENWFVMVNAPVDMGQDWDEITRATKQRIIGKIKKMTGIDINGHIVFERVMTPPGIEARTGSWHGALYGPSSNSRLSAFRRHPNFSSTIKGLYFVGGSVHPGGGIPLCLASAKITLSLIKKDFL